MPTRKQRRRRNKDLRHEWEEVYVDEEGRELAPEEVEELAPAAAAKNGAAPRPKGKAKSSQPAQTARGGRVVQPPSWRRVFKRTAIFAPLMYVFITLVDRSVSPLAALSVHAAAHPPLPAVQLPDGQADLPALGEAPGGGRASAAPGASPPR